MQTDHGEDADDSTTKHLARYQAAVFANTTLSRCSGGNMGEGHPILWRPAFDGARAWYTGPGHEIELYGKPVSLTQLRRGLRYAAGISARC